MSEDIIYELRLLWDSMVCGVFLSLGYDVLRIFRRVCKQQKWSVGAQDICYWMICGVMVFSLILRENSGNIRWYHLAGIGLGSYLYFVTISKMIVKYVSKAINFLCIPLRFCHKQIKRLLKPLKNHIKTVRIKHRQKRKEKKQQRKNDKEQKYHNKKKQIAKKKNSKRGEEHGKRQEEF